MTNNTLSRKKCSQTEPFFQGNRFSCANKLGRGEGSHWVICCDCSSVSTHAEKCRMTAASGEPVGQWKCVRRAVRSLRRSLEMRREKSVKSFSVHLANQAATLKAAKVTVRRAKAQRCIYACSTHPLYKWFFMSPGHLWAVKHQMILINHPEMSYLVQGWVPKWYYAAVNSSQRCNAHPGREKHLKPSQMKKDTSHVSSLMRHGIVRGSSVKQGILSQHEHWYISVTLSYADMSPIFVLTATGQTPNEVTFTHAINVPLYQLS